MIAADHGAVARKGGGQDTSDFYSFLGGGDDVPSVMILIDHLIEQLGATATPGVNGALAALRAHLAIDTSPSRLDDLPLPEPARPLPMAR